MLQLLQRFFGSKTPSVDLITLFTIFVGGNSCFNIVTFTSMELFDIFTEQLFCRKFHDGIIDFHIVYHCGLLHLLLA